MKYTKIIKSLQLGKEMPAGLGFIVQAILGSQSLLHVGALSVRWSEGFHPDFF